MPIVDDLVVLAAGMGPPAGQRHQVGAADEHVEPVVIQAYAQAMPDQARGDRVEDLTQREAA